MVYLEVQWRRTIASKDPAQLDAFIDIVRQVHASQSDLELGIPSSVSQTDAFSIDSCALLSENEAAVDIAAVQLMKKVACWNATSGMSIVLRKRIGGESPTEYIRRVLPVSDACWGESWPDSQQLSAPTDTVDDWPERIQYIASIATRYYAVGGNDVASVFRNLEQFHQFIEQLTPNALIELVTIAKTVADRLDHVFIMDWYNIDTTDGILGWPRLKALYFLALLERLREMDILAAIPGSRSIRYTDWNKMGG